MGLASGRCAAGALAITDRRSAPCCPHGADSVPSLAIQSRTQPLLASRGGIVGAGTRPLAQGSSRRNPPTVRGRRPHRPNRDRPRAEHRAHTHRCQPRRTSLSGHELTGPRLESPPPSPSTERPSSPATTPPPRWTSNERAGPQCCLRRNRQSAAYRLSATRPCHATLRHRRPPAGRRASRGRRHRRARCGVRHERARRVSVSFAGWFRR